MGEGSNQDGNPGATSSAQAQLLSSELFMNYSEQQNNKPVNSKFQSIQMLQNQFQSKKNSNSNSYKTMSFQWMQSIIHAR